jgi:hypothetical protein
MTWWQILLVVLIIGVSLVAAIAITVWTVPRAGRDAKPPTPTSAGVATEPRPDDAPGE